MRAGGLSAADKSAVTAACQQLIEGFLKPRFLPTIRPTQFNYPVDILGKCHGAKYRLIQRYRSGFPENLGEEFDAPFARLDWIRHNRFDIRWHRHTGEWFCLHRGLTLAEAIETLKIGRIAPSILNTATPQAQEPGSSPDGYPLLQGGQLFTRSSKCQRTLH
ncbi:hypothetical protein RAD15_05055 [Bradyrhizobium sp. 14AA]